MIPIFVLTILAPDAGKGQPFVTNTKPSYGTVSLLTSISTVINEAESEDTVTFRGIQGLIVDSTQSLYLRDIDRIYKFDHIGKFIGNIGRLGQGPGEYEAPRGMFIDTLDRFYLLDQGTKILIFDKNGVYSDSRTLRTMISPPFYVDPEGNVMGFSRRVEGNGVSKCLVLLDKSGGLIKDIASFLETDVRVKRGPAGGVMGGFKHPFSQDSFTCEIVGMGICYGMNLTYELSVFDMKGRPGRKIVNSERATPIAKDIEEIERGLGKNAARSWTFPEIRPFFGGLASDEKGRLYVLRIRSALSKEKSWNADVYDKKGDFVFQTIFPLKPECFHGDSYYAIDRDEDGRTIIKRVRILNFADLPY